MANLQNLTPFQKGHKKLGATFSIVSASPLPCSDGKFVYGAE
jgi:hypothetical protein